MHHIGATQAINIFVGAMLLLFGRRLFWLFVAGAGFVVGARLASEWMGEASELVAMLIALGAGLVGALLAVFLQRFAIAFGGFLSGGYLLYSLALGAAHKSLAWIAFLVGGCIGAILVILLLDWALIGLSALSGANVITQNVGLDDPESALLFFALLIIGVIVQSRQLKRITTDVGRHA